MILAIKTDNPQAELRLYQDDQDVDRKVWPAGRGLADSLLGAVEELLKANKAEFADLTGLVFFEGPGSFTGLRIGAAVANAMAYSLGIPIVGTRGESWQKRGLTKLKSASSGVIVAPYYGADANISQPKSA